MPAINPNTETCPECNSSWRAAPIPEASRHRYSPNSTHFSRLIGVELPGYDGVSEWQCPDCGAKWNRWTGEKKT